MKTVNELLEECRNLLRSPIWERSNGELLPTIDAYLATNGWIDPKDEAPPDTGTFLVVRTGERSAFCVVHREDGMWGFGTPGYCLNGNYKWQLIQKERKNMNYPNDDVVDGVIKEVAGAAELKLNLKDYGIPRDQFDYITKMAEDHGVKISIEYISCNPDLSLEDEQEEENRRVGVFNTRINDREMTPRQMTMDMKRHIAIILTKQGRKRKIILSIPFVEYNSNGKLMANTTIDVQDSIHEDFRGMCELCVCLLGTVDFWQYFIGDDIYKWAERHGFANSIEDEHSHLYQIFNYRKDITQSLIDIFGHDTMEKAMDDLSK